MHQSAKPLHSLFVRRSFAKAYLPFLFHRRSVAKEFFLFLFLAMGFNSCKQDPLSKGPTLIFGSFAGFCQGEQCIEIFKYEGGKIYEDTRDQYPMASPPYNGEYIRLNDSLKVYAEDLIELLPDSLFLMKDTIFGSPDAVDQGGMYLELIKDGEQSFWILDNFSKSLPQFLQPFSRTLRDRLNKLSR